MNTHRFSNQTVKTCKICSRIDKKFDNEHAQPSFDNEPDFCHTIVNTTTKNSIDTEDSDEDKTDDKTPFGYYNSHYTLLPRKGRKLVPTEQSLMGTQDWLEASDDENHDNENKK